MPRSTTKKKTIGDSLKAGRAFDPAMKTAELVGRIFTINDFREVHTENGDRRIASITLDGKDEAVDAWLNGALVDGQLDKLVEDDLLPAKVKLTTDPSIRDAYVLVEPGVGESFDAEVAAQNMD